MSVFVIILTLQTTYNPHMSSIYIITWVQWCFHTGVKKCNRVLVFKLVTLHNASCIIVKQSLENKICVYQMVTDINNKIPSKFYLYEIYIILYISFTMPSEKKNSNFIY